MTFDKSGVRVASSQRGFLGQDRAECSTYSDCVRENENIIIPTQETPRIGVEIVNKLGTIAGIILSKTVFRKLSYQRFPNLGLHCVGEDNIPQEEELPVH